MSVNPGQNPSNWSPNGNFRDSYQSPKTEEHVQLNKQMQLSAEELRVIKECQRESFYYRCVPLSAIFTGLVHFGLKAGYLSKRLKFMWLATGLSLGFFGGKISYQNKCVEKILQLTDSSLADAVRKEKGLFPKTLITNRDIATESTTLTGEGLMLEDRKLDLSEHNDGMDSYQKVTENLSPYTEETPTDKSYASYDDLRRMNRDGYNNKVAEKYRRPSQEPSPRPAQSYPDSSTFGSLESGSPNSSEPRREDAFSPGPEPYFNPKRNKYGDVWDN